jgi:acetylornithine deacetylase/succinyl-diaminopimelate desuccinylase-like protein
MLDATDLQEEATALLQRLIRINTVNPPGRERAAVELLAGYLSDAGFECRTFALDPERPSLVARLKGRGDGPTLGYLGHVDTVLADPEEWTHDPWSGTLADGCLWGRGALDMKSQVVAGTVAAAELARRGRPESGDLLVIAVADEEAGGRYGARFLTESHPEEVRCDFLVNEGGGQAIEHNGRRVYPVSCGEKGVFRFTVTTRGIAGHASIPVPELNALVKMAPLIERLAQAQVAPDASIEALDLLRTLGEPDDPHRAVELLEKTAPAIAAIVRPMLHMTLAPTRITASEKINVVPSLASLDVDCRAAPELDEDEVRRRVGAILGRGSHELEFGHSRPGNRSPSGSRLMKSIGSWISSVDPEAMVVPVIDPGFTDSHWFRAAFPECVAYGFFPMRHMTRAQFYSLIHGPDERIDVRDLGFATRFYAELAPELLGWRAAGRPRRQREFV